MSVCRRFLNATAITTALLAGGAAPAADNGASPEGHATIAKYAKQEADNILLRATDSENWDAAVAEAERLLLAVSMSSEPIREADAWIESARAVLVTKLIDSAPETSKQDLVRLATIQPALVGEVAYLLNAQDNWERAAGVLLRLYGQYGKVCAEYPALTAALCAVHDRTVSHRMNENVVQSAQPEQLFAFFIAWERRLHVDLRSDPPEMLTYMVDVAPPIEELEWAIRRYAGMSQIGTLYNAIDYDIEHYINGRVKKITEEGYSLENISRYGGVCVDQAYYSSMIGKAIGVPAVMIDGSAASGGGHCWLGYLRQNNRGYQWDMKEGRYDEAKFFSGTGKDPQSGRRLSEAVIGISEQLFSTSDKERLLTRALVEAALLLSKAEADPDPIVLHSKKRARGKNTTSQFESKSLKHIRQRGMDSANNLLHTAHKICPGSRELWNAMGWLSPEMDIKEMGWWIEAAAHTGGDRWPEFTYVITQKILNVLEDDIIAAEAWEKVHRLYRGRPDLQMLALIAAGDRAADAGEKEAAARAYEQAINQYSGQSEHVIDALAGISKLYKDVDRPDLLLDLCRQVWYRAMRPDDSALGFFRQSVWFRVGIIYAYVLDDAGQERKAASIRNTVISAGIEAQASP